jgi:hypothetical protein
LRELTREGTTSLLESLLTVCTLQVAVLASIICAAPSFAIVGTDHKNAQAYRIGHVVSIANLALIVVSLCWLGVFGVLSSLHSAKVHLVQMKDWYAEFANLIKWTQFIFICGVAMMTYCLLVVSWVVSPTCNIMGVDYCEGSVILPALFTCVVVALSLVLGVVFHKHRRFIEGRSLAVGPRLSRKTDDHITRRGGDK